MYIDFGIKSESMCVTIHALGNVKTNKPDKEWVSIEFKDGVTTDSEILAYWDGSKWIRDTLIPFLNYNYEEKHPKFEGELAELEGLLEKSGSDVWELKEMFDKAIELEFI